MPLITKEKNLTSVKCVICTKLIDEEKQFLKCDSCEQIYHPRCKNIIGNHLNKLGLMEVWYCSKNCTPCTPLKYNSPKQTQTNIDLENITKIIDNLLQEHLTQFDNKLSKKIEEIQKSQQFISEMFEELKENNKKLNEDNEKLRKELSATINEQQKQKILIQKLEYEFDKINQKECENNLVITGIPSCKIEPLDFLQKMFNYLKVKFDQNNIQHIKLIEVKANSKENIVEKHEQSKKQIIFVSFKSPEIKKQLMDKKRELKVIFFEQLGFQDATKSQIFLRDHLTVYQMNLYQQAAKIKSKYLFEYLWFKNGNIHLRKESNSKVFIIKTKNDLEKLELMFGNTILNN